MNGELLVLGDGTNPGAKKLESVIGTVTVGREEKEKFLINNSKELSIGINKSRVSCCLQSSGHSVSS